MTEYISDVREALATLRSPMTVRAGPRTWTWNHGRGFDENELNEVLHVDILAAPVPPTWERDPRTNKVLALVALWRRFPDAVVESGPPAYVPDVVLPYDRFVVLKTKEDALIADETWNLQRAKTDMKKLIEERRYLRDKYEKSKEDSTAQVLRDKKEDSDAQDLRAKKETEREERRCSETS